jgi:four helix bundle protein
MKKREKNKMVARCRVHVAGYGKNLKLQYQLLFLCFAEYFIIVLCMKNYRDLDIYQIAFDLAVRVHKASIKLPKFELFEQGSQIRRSSKSIKDQIAEGYGRRRYKADYIKFLIYSHSSCDETTSQLEMLIILYPEESEFQTLIKEYEILGRKINNYIEYVENNWRT